MVSATPDHPFGLDSYLPLEYFMRGFLLLALGCANLFGSPMALAQVKTTEHGVQVNDRPFFPFGLFCVGWTEADSPAALADAKRLGCNTVQSYWACDVDRSVETVKAYLDEANRLGLKVVPTVGDYRSPRQAVKENNEEPLRRSVKRMIAPFKHHPAVLAWYVWDEPNAGEFAAEPEVVKALADAVKREDPDHPTFFSFTPWHNLERISSYGKCCDIIAVDPYVRAKFMGLVPQSVEAARRAAGPERPVWSVIWAAQNAGGMEPQVAEVRCSTYLSLIHGATGIFYYGHKGEPGRQGPTPKNAGKGWQRGVGEPELACLAEAIAQLGAEIRLLTPGLLGKLPTGIVTANPAGGPIHFRELQMAGRRIVLAANATKEPVQASFRLREGEWADTARVMFEERSIELADNVFRDDFAPLATHVYEVAPRS